MKKLIYSSWLVFCAIMLVGIGSGRVYARLTGTNPGTDVHCVGISGAEICVDVSGNLIPTTNNDTTLGTSSLQFANAYLVDATISGDLTVADQLTVSGPVDLAIQTTTQLTLRSDSIGSVFLVQERVNGALVSNAYNVCVATAANIASYVYVSVSTSAQAVAGSACDD